MNIVSPYKNVEQYTRVEILPCQMNSDIINSLKFNLKKDKEKKCNKNGYIDEIYAILQYSDGIMNPENLSGKVFYNVTFSCKICSPIENSIIIGQVRMINQELVFVINGPIMIFVPRDKVDQTYWDVSENYTHKQKKNVKLAIENFVCIQIINKRINKNDDQIKVIGKLLDLATEDQVNKYFGSNIVNEDNYI
jgi:DNA-directed RNA polymerase subunit E'/Rpb7